MDEKYYQILVKRYIDKKLTNDELEVFVHLMKQGILDEYLRVAMENELVAEDGFDIEEPEKRIGIYFRRWSVAAAIIISLGIGAYFIKQYRPFSKIGNGAEVAVLQQKDTIRVSNNSATIAKQVLPDGSRIWLHPQTVITYPSTFKGQKLREVGLQGEAFFEVTKDAAHPFVITTGKVLTKVWGTSFRIKALKGQNVKVSVLTGKVSVSVPAKVIDKQSAAGLKKLDVMLKPDEEATYIDTAHDLKKSEITSRADLLIWHKSNLSFENRPLKEVITALNSDYNMHISAVGEALKGYHLTADFNGKNLPDIMLLICKSVNATYTLQGNDIIISGIN